MKYYVVFNGPNPGVYDNWDDAKAQINFKGARYKSYPSSQEAAAAFRRESEDASAAGLGRFLSQAGNHNITKPGQPD